MLANNSSTLKRREWKKMPEEQDVNAYERKILIGPWLQQMLILNYHNSAKAVDLANHNAVNNNPEPGCMITKARRDTGSTDR
jgi:hypothetical protein